MIVKNIMTSGVKTVHVNSTVQDAARIMNELKIGSLIVMDKDRLMGIITERDILAGIVEKAKDSSKVLVKEIMTPNVIVVESDMKIDQAVELMNDKGIKKLPVVEKGNLIGIVTAVDIANAQPKLVKKIADLMHIHKKKIIAG